MGHESKKKDQKKKQRKIFESTIYLEIWKAIEKRLKLLFNPYRLDGHSLSSLLRQFLKTLQPPFLSLQFLLLILNLSCELLKSQLFLEHTCKKINVIPFTSALLTASSSSYTLMSL